MASKLDEIKAALAEYDEANTAYYKAASNQLYDDLPPLVERVDKAHKRLATNAPDYLRALLAVADAAKEFVNHPNETHPDWFSESYMATLKAALKALD